MKLTTLHSEADDEARKLLYPGLEPSYKNHHAMVTLLCYTIVVLAMLAEAGTE